VTKESVVLILLVAAGAAGIIYAIRKASTNEGDWAEYEKVQIGDTSASVLGRFTAVAWDLRTITDARSAGQSGAFKEVVEQGGARLLVIPAGPDFFLFGFDASDRLVYRNFRRPPQ
jgi:hypothetical protein